MGPDTTCTGGRMLGIRGEPVLKNEFPFLVRVESCYTKCSGVLISSFHVLTSIMCVHWRQLCDEFVKVYIKDHDQGKEDGETIYESMAS